MFIGTLLKTIFGLIENRRFSFSVRLLNLYLKVFPIDKHFFPLLSPYLLIGWTSERKEKNESQPLYSD